MKAFEVIEKFIRMKSTELLVANCKQLTGAPDTDNEMFNKIRGLFKSGKMLLVCLFARYYYYRSH